MATLIQTKVCSRPACESAGRPQPIENFYLVSSSGAARRAACKECCLTTNKKTSKIHYEKNADAIRASQREYMRGRKEQNKEQSARWRKNNPDKVTANTRRRKARIRGSLAEPYDPIQIFERDSWTCGICRRGIDLLLRWPDPMSRSIDHILPISMGGADVANNVRASHLRCNVLRGNGTNGIVAEI